MTHLTQVGPLVLMAVALSSACGRSEGSRQGEAETGAADSVVPAAAAARAAERRVTNVMIGRRSGPGNRITEPSFEFGPRDTVHVSVATEGLGGTGTLTAAWRFQNGEIVEQSSQQAQPGDENTAFHLAPAKGLKPGTYKMVLFLGDDSVDTKVFVVKK